MSLIILHVHLMVNLVTLVKLAAAVTVNFFPLAAELRHQIRVSLNLKRK